jgi:hypothetical protein
MIKRIIIEMNVDYWTPEVRKEVMRYLIHNLKVVDEDDHSNFKGSIIEPASPYPLIPIQKPDDKEYEIVW